MLIARTTPSITPLSDITTPFRSFGELPLGYMGEHSFRKCSDVFLILTSADASLFADCLGSQNILV